MSSDEPGFIDEEGVAETKVIVLLVDDQLMVGEAIRRALVDESDLKFYFCSEPQAALVMAEKLAPTVILQDLVMPDIDGLALVREYRSHEGTRHIPVIVLSTREEAKTKSEAFAAGANDYMVKLPDRIELLARIRYHSQAYLGHKQRDAAYRALHQNRQQLMAANIELQRLSNMDGLTQLNNRRRFDEYITAEWRRARREQAPLSLLLADVDYFKRYNDTYGHLAGDEVLKKVAQAIRNCCERPADLVARYGGEEFAVVLPSTRANGAHIIGERMRDAVLALQIAHSGSSVGPHVTLSVGGAVAIPTEPDGALDLMAAADENLYEAKEKGRNRVVVRE